MKREFVIGTRGSDLALWQANTISSSLKHIGVSCTIKIISTKGDEIQDLSFDKMEGKGFFTKEIEQALLNNEIDIAVHSHKDLETTMPTGLCIAAVSEREDARDVLLVRKDKTNELHSYGLFPNAIIGTSSQRRKSLLNLFFTDIKINDLRGNVPTRIQKLRDGNYDAIILAYAGLLRLKINLSEFSAYPLPYDNFIPAAAQGVLALQCRDSDTECLESLKKLNNTSTQRNIWLEREILNKLEGGCLLPIGVHSICEDGLYSLHATYAKTATVLPKRIYLQGPDPQLLARIAVNKLKTQPVLKRVLFSREKNETSIFEKILLENKFEIHNCGLTYYRGIKFENVPECNWIFFSSRQCVNFFFANKPVLPKGIKFGTIGGATTDVLKKYGYTSTFSGYGSDTKEVGKGFSKLAKNEKILFPQSSGSYRTIQKQFLDQSNLIDLVVYDTLPTENILIPVTDVAVLTSPTNTILYLRQKPKDANPIYIAMGKSTGEILQQHGITNYILPWNSSEIALADAVMSL